MSDTAADPVSRRQFLGVCGVAGSAALVGPAAATRPSSSHAPSLQSPDDPASMQGEAGTISPRGQQSIAAVDRLLAQQQEPPQRTVHAVRDMGLDPQGNTPINAAFESAVNGMANVRIVFPDDATFRLSGEMQLSPAGPIEIIGNGATLRMDPNTIAYAFNFAELPSGSLIQDLVIDMNASGTLAGIRLATDGVVEVRDLTMRGYADPYPADMDAPNILVPVARTPEAVVRVTNFRATGGTAAGMHQDPDAPASAPENRMNSPICLWVGQSTLGTIQMVNPRIRAWSNGTYSGRTKGRVEILGGVLWNNTNCQVRISGDSVCDGSTLVLDDRQWSMQRNPGPYRVGGRQGVNAVRVDPGGDRGNQTDPVHLRNLDIRGLSMEISSSLIDFEGSAGPGHIRNCRITNHLEATPIVWGEQPGSQFNYDAAPQTNMAMDQCRVQGNSPSPVMEADGRPESRVQRTCITISDAGPADIIGAQIGRDVSFGQCTSASGLRAPEQVGSNVSVSELPAPNVSYNGATGRRGGGGGGGGGGGFLGWAGKLLAGLTLAPLIGITIVILPIILGLVMFGAATFGSSHRVRTQPGLMRLGSQRASGWVYELPLQSRHASYGL